MAGSASVKQRALELAAAPTTVLDVRGARPVEALQRLRLVIPKDAKGRREWFANARVAAIMGSCPKSRASFTAGGVLLSLLQSVKFLPFSCDQESAIGASLPRSITGMAILDFHLASMQYWLGRILLGASAHSATIWAIFAEHATRLRWMPRQLVMLLSRGQ